jgi:hypothetical protein
MKQYDAAPTPVTNPEKHLPKSFVTAKGSIYTYGPNGRCAGYKTATGELFEPFGITVFTDLEKNPYTEIALLQAAKEYTTKLVQADETFTSTGKYIESPEDVVDPYHLLVEFPRLDGRALTAPASLYPSLGQTVYEQTVVKGVVIATHVGNEVVAIEA